MLQALWRWLWDAKHQIPKDDRPYLLHMFKDMLYADSVDSLQARCGLTIADAISAKYPNYATHITNNIEWSLVDRMELSVRGNHTTTHCEAGMTVLKDKIFHCLRVYNVAQLTDFMLTRLEDYHVHRLTDVSNNWLPSHGVISRFYPSQKDVCLDDVTEVGTNGYCVNSRKRKRKQSSAQNLPPPKKKLLLTMSSTV